MEEVWRVIKGFPDYAVSNVGRVKRLTTRTSAKAGSILKTPPRSAGRYLAVDLCHDGSKKTMQVHRLVAIAFIGEPPFGKPEVNHKNGNNTDNSDTNLEWVSSSENQLHAYKTGLQSAIGDRNGQAKLTDDQVREIRIKAIGKRGEKAALAREFSVSSTTIRDVLKRKVWGHVV